MLSVHQFTNSYLFENATGNYPAEIQFRTLPSKPTYNVS